MKDATIEIISSVEKHPNADRLEIANILGFKCVTQKGLYKGGETIVYIRPDAVLPEMEWAVSYRQYSPVRVKAVKLRDVWSEGIIVPFELFPEDIQKQLKKKKVGDEVNDIVSVYHFEPPVRQNEEAKGGMPLGIPKTDEERVENLVEKNIPYNSLVDISLKIDGQSCSFFYEIETDRFGILARKEEIKTRWDGENIFEKAFIWAALKFPVLQRFLKARNNYDHVCEKYGMKNKLIEYCKKHNVSLVIRGETYGTGLQDHERNPHSKVFLSHNNPCVNFPEDIILNDRNWAMYSVYLIKERRYAEKGDKFYYPNVAKEMGLPICPMIEENVILTHSKINYYSSEIKKLNGVPFEGVVVKHEKNSFKIINKAYDAEK